MTWSDDLVREERRQLRKIFLTLDDAAAATIEHPDYAEECEQLA